MAVFNADRDGRLYRIGLAAESYATVHDDTTGTASTWNVTVEISQDYTSSKYNVRRGGLVFDTSSIPSSATISSAILSLYGHIKGVDQDFSITIVSGTNIADNYPDPGYNDFVDGDYGDLLAATTSFGSMLASDFQVNATTPVENQITLNATGIAAIVKAGITKFGIRSSRDINSNAPTGGVTEYIQFRGCNGSYPPQLTVVYTVPFIPRVFIV